MEVLDFINLESGKQWKERTEFLFSVTMLVTRHHNSTVDDGRPPPVSLGGRVAGQLLFLALTCCGARLLVLPAHLQTGHWERERPQLGKGEEGDGFLPGVPATGAVRKKARASGS